MTGKEFKVKRILCDTSDVHVKTKEIEGQWVEALLTRAGVPELLVRRRLDGRTSNINWRHYLFDKFHLDVLKDRGLGKVRVVKYMDGDRDGRVETIAEWSKPEVVRINKRGQKPHCELKLKYWQLI